MVAALDNGKQSFYVGIYPPTGDYELLDNQPAVDGVVLTKDTTKADLDLDKVFQYRGQVETYSKLPTKNLHIGDTYNVADTGENYAWNGSSWDLLTGTEAVYWRNGALESLGSTLTIDSDKNPITNLVLADITDVTSTKTEVNQLHSSGVVKSDLTKLHNITATATEVNVLDGITASTTELNYVDGVTSSIQTQLDNKVEKNNAITGATKCKITYDDKGLVTAGADLDANDIPDISATYQTVISDLETIRSGASAGATALQPNAAITGATKCKITYDSNGLVTAGDDLQAADIPDLSATYQPVINDLADIRSGASAGATAVQAASGDTAPDISTVGVLGKIYIDTTTQTAYMCVGVDTETPEYTWKQITA